MTDYCKRGHYRPENTYTSPSGHAECQACRKMRQTRKYRATQSQPKNPHPTWATVEEATHMEQVGLGWGEICQKLDMNAKAVARAFERVGHPDTSMWYRRDRIESGSVGQLEALADVF